MECEDLVFTHQPDSKKSEEKIGSIAKLTINFMYKHHIPFTPLNYEEWFYVFCKALEEGHRLSEKNLQILYQTYFSNIPSFVNKEEMKEISLNLKDLTKHSHEMLDKFESNIKTHNTYIDESVVAIEKEDLQKMEMLKEKISTLEDENEKLKSFIEKYRGKLDEIEEKFNAQKKEIEIDALTQVFNRRSFDKDMQYLDSVGIDYSLIILDIDNFKKINDTFGHLIGDEVLKEIGEILHNFIRKNSKAYRYGGEEFVVVLPKTSLEEARKVAQRLKEIVENRHLQLQDGTHLNFTASFGIAQKREGETYKDVLKRADEALYEAKRLGKNQVIIKE